MSPFLEAGKRWKFTDKRSPVNMEETSGSAGAGVEIESVF